VKATFRHDAIAAFEREVAAFGLHLPRGGVVGDGKLRRLDDSHHHRKHNRAGWYWLRELPSGLLIGGGGSWWGNRGKFDWSSRSEATFTPADHAALKEQIARAEAERAQRYSEGVALAERVWVAGKPCTSHPYLTHKAVNSYGLRVDGRGNLLVPLRDLDGNLRGVQRIGREGEKLFTKGTDRQAPTCLVLGTLDEALIVLVVEGYASGATAHEATGLPVVVAFDAGGVKKIARPLRDRLPRTMLVFCGDNDPQEKGATGQKAAYAAARVGGGIVSLPPVEGHDWNDHAAVFGLDDVRERLGRATGGFLPKPTVTLEAGAATLDRAIGAFFERAAKGNENFAEGINITMGAGKSFAARAAAATLLQGDPNKAVHFFLPMHRLIEESAEKLKKDNGVHAAIWRGMDQVDPEHSDSRKMCTEGNLVRLGRNAGLDQDNVCAACPSVDSCGWQRQKGQCAQSWFMTHNLAFQPRPKAIPAPAAKVFDERFYTAGMVEKIKVAASSLEGDLLDVGHVGDRELLLELRGPLLQALRIAAADATPGRKRVRLARKHLEASGLNALFAPEAARIEWSRKPTLKRVKGEDAEALADRIKAQEGKFNPHVPMLWELVARLRLEDVSVNIEVEPNARLEGGEGTGLVVHMQYRLGVHPSWASPTLVLDGTAEALINEKFFPALGQLQGVEVEAPHMHVEWICGSFAKHRLVPKPGNGRKNVTVENTLLDIQHCIEVEAAAARRTAMPQVLVVTHKDTRKVLRDGMTRQGTMPGNVVIEHFSNTRGVDAFKDAGCIIVIGRPLPPPAKIHRQAEVLAGEPLPEGDPLVDAVRRSICESELLQVIGRARAIRRTADRPLRVVVMNDVPLPLPVEKITPWEDAKAHPLDLLAARGVVLDCESDAKGYWEVVAAVLPDRFRDAKAAWDWGREFRDKQGGSRMKAPNNNILLGKYMREAGALSLYSPVKLGVAGGRYSIAARIDPAWLAFLKRVLDVEPIEPEAPVDRVTGPRARMLETGGAALINPGHAVQVFPDIWPIVPRAGESEGSARTRTIDTAKKSIQRDPWRFEGVPRIGYALYRDESRRVGRPTAMNRIYFDAGTVRRPGRWLAERLRAVGGITLQALHNPARADGGVRCPITGAWNFGFAPTRGVAWDDVQGDGDDVVNSTTQDDRNMTTMNEMELLDQIEAETATNPEWFGVLVSMGADDLGVDAGLVGRMWTRTGGLLALSEDESQSPERRALYGRISQDAPSADVLVALAIAGQRFVNRCVATVAAERAHATL